MKKLPKLTLVVLLCMIYSLSASAQKRIYVVEGGTKTPVDYIYGYVLNGSDSTIIKEYFGSNGLLELGEEIFLNSSSVSSYVSSRILYLTGMGVKERYIAFSGEQSLPDTVVMELNSYATEDVVIRGARGITSQRGGKTVVNVGTSELLKGMPSVMDILNYSPGIKVSGDENITIFGKGTPLIIIDGMEASGTSELTALQPDQIKTIEIDRNPSSKYGATYQSVVVVKTSRSKSDKLSMQIYNTARYSGNFTDFTGVTLNSGVGKFRNYISYDFKHTNSNTKQDQYDISLLKDYTQTILTKSDYDSKRNSHNLLAGTKYLINDKNTIDVQYNFSQNKSLGDGVSNISIERPGVRRLYENTLDNNSRPASNIINTKYTLDIDSISYLNIFLDYISTTKKSDNYLYEWLITENSNSDTRNISNSRSNVVTGRVEYENMILPKHDLRLLVGGKFSSINNFYDYSSLDINRNNYIYDNHNLYKDETAALYLSLNGSFGKLSLDVALRGEANHNRSVSNDATLNNEWMYNLFPSLFADFEFSNKASLSFGYSNKIKRPMLSEIDPSIIYLNEFSFQQGNPLLKPTIMHDLFLTAVLWQNLTLGVSYSINRNPSILAAEIDEQNQNMLRYSYVNFSNSKTAGINVGYDNSWGIFTLNAECNLYYTTSDIPYLGNIEKRHNSSVDLYITNSFNILKNFSIYYTFNYTSKYMELSGTFPPSYLLSAGASLSLLDKTLQISLSANDLLKREGGWDERYGYINSGSREIRDSRYVGVTIRYKFKNFSSNFRRINSSQDEIGRL